MRLGGAVPRPLWRQRAGNGPARPLKLPFRARLCVWLRLCLRGGPRGGGGCGGSRREPRPFSCGSLHDGGRAAASSSPSCLRKPQAEMDSLERSTIRSEQKSRKFLKSLITKQPRDLLLVIGTGVSAAVAPGIPALCSWRSCIEAVIEAAEQLEVLHPGDVAEFRKKVIKDRDLLVVAHDLIRKMSPRTGDTKPNFFQDCLMEVFDNLEQHIQNPVVLQSILRLMERGTMVLTTNYDNLLEIFGHQQGKPMESLDLKDKDKVLQWARGHIKYGVLHIHGLYTDPCGMVLDPSGYKDVTQDPEVMNKVDLEHYMLVLKENEDHFFKLQADMLLHGIKVVSYGDCFIQFPEYVQDLTTQICKHRSPGTSCMDSAKRKLRENGTDSPKRIKQSDNGPQS
ncbi:Protein FAM118A isoform X1 [Aix galericulata]|nr:Protein FAM118A isoform X1 [Aix galericulata]